MQDQDKISTNLWNEIAIDLRANGWDNNRLGTCLRIVLFELSFQTLLLYRLQVRLERIPYIGRFLRRILAWFTGIVTSCEINALATIEGGVSLPHPKGIIIGKGCVVRSGATIYQHVTIGTRAGHGEEEKYPVIEGGSKIYAGAVLIGGIRIGANATVGANAVVLNDVPESKTAVGVPARIL